jgi:phenylalanyl-tRNA synthetase beta chain
MGLLKTGLARRYDLERPVFCAEIDLAELLQKQPRPFKFQAIPKFPGISRDLSFLIAADIPYQQINQQLGKLHVPYLESFMVYDRFQGKSLIPGTISYSVRFFFRHSDRTLQAEEVDRIMQDIITQLKSSLKIILR